MDDERRTDDWQGWRVEIRHGGRARGTIGLRAGATADEVAHVVQHELRRIERSGSHRDVADLTGPALWAHLAKEREAPAGPIRTAMRRAGYTEPEIDAAGPIEPVADSAARMIGMDFAAKAEIGKRVSTALAEVEAEVEAKRLQAKRLHMVVGCECPERPYCTPHVRLHRFVGGGCQAHAHKYASWTQAADGTVEPVEPVDLALGEIVSFRYDYSKRPAQVTHVIVRLEPGVTVGADTLGRKVALR